jgi:PPOX class probable F420-dependent enzyme
MPVIDPKTDLGEAVTERLEDELIIWLTTLGATGAAHPRPVWFHWENDEFLIYSKPDGAKLRHIARDGRVALNFNTSHDGGNVAVINGTARIVENEPKAIDTPAYLAKYKKEIADIGLTPESFSAAYSVPIRVVPEKLWGF